MSIKAWRQFTPFYFYTIIVLLLAYASAGKSSSTTGVLILLVTGFLTWGLIEYVLHRFVFHFHPRSSLGSKFLSASHLSHHENPKATDRLFASLKMTVPIAAAYFLIAWAVLRSWSAASYLFIGLTAGYFTYEWLHFQAHHGRAKLPLLRYLKKYHLLHHYRTPDLRFGVTSPAFDFLFGTFRSLSKRESEPG